MGIKISFSILALTFAVIYIGCNRNNNDTLSKTQSTSIQKSDSVISGSVDKSKLTKTDSEKTNTTSEIYNYEPDTSVVLGIVKKELFFGPPGYGETPKKDSKENCYILYLLKPVRIKPVNGSDKDFDIEQNSIDKFQIYSNNNNVNNFFENHLSDRIMVRGKFFGAQTGHHHTPVMMEVFEYIYNNN